MYGNPRRYFGGTHGSGTTTVTGLRMSCSKRKTLITGITTAVIEKAEKAAWHRQYCHAEKMRLHAEGAEYVGRSHREHSNLWSMGKDGKRYRKEISAELLRK